MILEIEVKKFETSAHFLHLRVNRANYNRKGLALDENFRHL
jgi:hypothetical protein